MKQVSSYILPHMDVVALPLLELLGNIPVESHILTAPYLVRG